MKYFRLAIVQFFGFLLLCVITANASAFDLDDLKSLTKDIDKIRGKVSTSDEIDMGNKLLAGLLGAAPLVDDERLQRYVNDVGYWVASHSGRKKLPWRFGVINSSGINAFAAPGGQIVITAGLYLLLENEAQLAAVLAHEIAHVKSKHHLKALQKSMKRDFWTGIGTKVVDDESARKKLDKLVNAGIKLYATGLDRKYEYQADRDGVVLAARAGYDPFALLDVLTTIESINPDDADMSVLLKTHPPISKRLKQLNRSMGRKLDKYAEGRHNTERFRSNPLIN
jgi:beta-barrel assembly-enhancing protease